MIQAEITTALDAALSLAREGRQCFPCRGDKRPATPHGFKDGTSDSDALRDLWRHYPGPLTGVPTGATTGIGVLDLDKKHPEAGAWWTENRHRLPETRTHRTRSGGLHLIFRHTAGMRCTAAKIAPGVDTRGDGGFIIWWPAAGLPVLCCAPPAPLPAWLLADLQPAKLTGRPERRVTVPDEHALGQLVRLVAGACEGGRNNLTFWAACRAGEMAAAGLLDAETAEAVIADAAMRAGLTFIEAARTARSGVQTGLGVRHA